MPPVTIENPILNSPFTEPTRHFRFTGRRLGRLAAAKKRQRLPIAVDSLKELRRLESSRPSADFAQRHRSPERANFRKLDHTTCRHAREVLIEAITRDAYLPRKLTPQNIC